MIVFGCLVVGLFFLRFFRRSRDRLFLFFALSFFLLAAERFTLAILTSYYGPLAPAAIQVEGPEPPLPAAVEIQNTPRKPELMTTLQNIAYWVRAFAYVLIIAGIVDKNFSAQRDPNSG
jgi:hypothetical protein